MAEIILHPRHPDYCNECIYHGGSSGNCQSGDYNRHIYKVNCVWHYCPYRRGKGCADGESSQRMEGKEGKESDPEN
ncbi:MAG: hypothetical protein K1W36_06615 [Lachnospiraceae bacterium]